MKIAQIAPFEESVPPKKYGGTELVVYNLTQELVKKGHQVYLIATGDSKTKAKILPVFKIALRKHLKMSDLKIRDAFKIIGIGRVLNYLKNLDVDIIHNHLGWRLLPFSHLIKKPVVTTLHGPLDVEYQRIIYENFKDANYVSISNNQRKPLPNLNYLATVYNGIDIKKFPFSEKKGNYLAFLGRMSPEKGPDLAIRAALKTGLKLKMAAKIDVVDKKFFEREIAPFIDNKQIEFLGEVGHIGKVKLLKNALALIAPIQWQEPFGLFFIEAMATGTPVITFKRGSAPEIVKDKKTGFVVKPWLNKKPNLKGLIKAIYKIKEIRRDDCRKWVEKNFTSEKMADNYEKVYYGLLKKERESG